MKSNSIFETLNLLVIGRTGIILSKIYPESQDKETFEISFKVDEEMTPVVDVIVFYMRDQDGEIVHDKFRLEIPTESSNSVRSLNLIDFTYFN